MGAPPLRLAKALSAAVKSVLQARRSLPAAIARLVALLCAPKADRLAGAAILVDCDDLAHRLLTALAKKSRGFLWTDGLMQAATVAVDLLLALPAASEAAAAAQAAEGASFEAPDSGSDGEPAPLETPAALAAPHAASNSGYVSDAGRAGDAANTGFDFSTKDLDELCDSVPDEGTPMAKPLISALGLKDTPSPARLASGSNKSSLPVSQANSGPPSRPRERRRLSSHSSRLPACSQSAACSHCYGLSNGGDGRALHD